MLIFTNPSEQRLFTSSSILDDFVATPMDGDMRQDNFLANHDFSTAYATLSLFTSGPLAGQNAEIDCEANGARFELDCELASLFPYINAVADHAQYYEKPVYIRFMLAERLCAFYSTEGAMATTPATMLAHGIPTDKKTLRTIKQPQSRETS